MDTNVIIEAIRMHCWHALCGHYRIETVEKCVEEARTGDAYRPGYVEVEDRDLRGRLVARKVGNGELADIALREPGPGYWTLANCTCGRMRSRDRTSGRGYSGLVPSCGYTQMR
ncbi:MAG: hypothetical protein WB783_08330 [Arenicellales bacterium]